MIGVYIHIPFCRTKCPYCDFLSVPIPGDIPREYVDALRREIAEFDGPDETSSVFFGGGTPSLLENASLADAIDAVSRRFRLADPEITIEANPDDVSIDRIRAWRAAGVNRLSLGVQSFDDRVLEGLGRRHDAAAARRACALAAEDFDNWGMDLIFGDHPVDTWRATLDACLEFAPSHISTYGLTYESNTQFGCRAHEAIDDDAWLALYREAKTRLAGYARYEVSNFARPGFECRHNLVYWRNETYAGFGLGAYGFDGRVRARNATMLAEYLARPGKKEERIELSDAEIRLETVIQHLRIGNGIAADYYANRFRRSLWEDFGTPIDALAARGLVIRDDAAVWPTDRGFELNNEIGLALIPD